MIDRWLQCPICGEDVFEPDEDGLFYEGTSRVCPSCYAMVWIDVDFDSEVASVVTDDECADVGQPRCDGSCGAIEEFVGLPGSRGLCARCDIGRVVELVIEEVPRD